MKDDKCHEPLARIFDDRAFARFHEFLAAHAPSASEWDVTHVRWLVEVLTASGPPPTERRHAERLAFRRASRAALDTYVSAAGACGLLDANMVERLRSTQERNFRSARAECLAALFLAGRFGHPVVPVIGGGRARKQLEFVVTTPNGPPGVEVKASRVDRPKSGHYMGDDFKTL